MTARVAVQFIELDIDWCALSYGVGACPAVLGVDSAYKCFNTKATCPVVASYSSSTVTLRFTEESAMRDLSVDALTNLVSVSFSPSKIRPGEDLGQRSSLNVVLRDMPHSDTGDGFDKYAAERAYNPYTLGTLFGRFRARQPYIRGAALRWYVGYADQSLADMECRKFVVDSFDGPSADGKFVLKGTDPLKLLDGDRAQVPALSNGRLIADITDVATTATLTPAGIGNAEYPSSGYLAIGGNEIVAFTRVGDALTFTGRGQLGTPASAHSAADMVQLVKRYVAADPADIIYDLMVNGAGVPASYITLADWQAETAGYLRRTYTRTLGAPQPAKKLVDELMRQAGLSVWPDDVAGKIRLRVLRAIPTSAIVLSPDNVLPGTFSRAEQPTKRVSTVLAYYGMLNPLGGVEDVQNYRTFAVSADLEAIANYGDLGLLKLYCGWIAQGGNSAALRAGELLLKRYGTPPRSFRAALMRDAQERPELGNGYQLRWLTEQDAFGASESVPVQVLSLEARKEQFILDLEESRFPAASSDPPQITISFDALDVNFRDWYDDNYPTPADGTVVTLIIDTGITVGASSPTTPALDTGTWPTRTQTANRTSGSPVLTSLSLNTAGLVPGMRVAGAGIQAGSAILSVDSASQITLDKNATGSGTGGTITIQTVILNVINRGRIGGAGGDGGIGANGVGDVPGTAGAAGGTAFKVRAAITFTDTGAQTWGGGGGGGGGPCRDFNDHKGGGGGGGGGVNPGAGGDGPGNDAQDGAAGTRTAGGAGGWGWTNANFFAGPRLDSVRRGGDGGDPGSAGQPGQGSSDVDGGAGGAAGAAIDGVSLVITSGTAGDRRGGQIN